MSVRINCTPEQRHALQLARFERRFTRFWSVTLPLRTRRDLLRFAYQCRHDAMDTWRSWARGFDPKTYGQLGATQMDLAKLYFRKAMAMAEGGAA